MIRHNSPSFTASRRRAFTLLEVALSAAALGFVAVSVVQATVGLDRARVATNRLDYASRELENSLREFSNQPVDDITQAAANEWQLAAGVAQQLPGARLTTTVVDEQDPAARRVTMKLQLAGRESPLVLTHWVPTAEPIDDEVQP